MTGLRFCMVTTFYPPYNFGGDGMGIQRLSQALVRRGHHVTVVQDVDPFNYLNGGDAPRSGHTDDGIEVIRLHSNFARLSMLLTQQTGRPVVHGRRIRSILDRGFDVINFHNISLVGGPGVLQAGHALKLYMAHEHWLVCPSHVLWRHNREACTGRECLRCVMHFRRPPQLWRYTGYLERQLRHIDSFIAMSEFSRRKHREMGFPRDMEVVNYFLPEKSQPPSAWPQPSSQRPYFLFVGRLERIKGLDDVIPAFRSYPAADLVIIGDGDHAPALKKLAANIPNVRFLGRLSPEALDDYYRNALALIVPSTGFETFGIILIEAFRQGTPVIARDIGPFPEIVHRCGGGELFREPQDLIAAMERLRTDPELRPKMSRAAYEGFKTYWSEAAVLPAYLEVVRRAAARTGKKDVLRKLEVRGTA